MQCYAIFEVFDDGTTQRLRLTIKAENNKLVLRHKNFQSAICGSAWECFSLTISLPLPPCTASEVICYQRIASATPVVANWSGDKFQISRDRNGKVCISQINFVILFFFFFTVK